MIILKELNPHNFDTDDQINYNLDILLDKLNKLQKLYKGPIIITSGLRSQALQHKLIANGRSTATKSNHLIGAAADIYDPDGLLYNWLKENESVLIDLCLWCEERMGPWQHLQIFPPKSGKRWFYP